jgi:hypothetical protein
VKQTSSATRRSGAKAATTSKTGSMTPKAVDRKKLQALEAEVFKSLDYSPTAGVKGSAIARPSYSATPTSSITTSDSLVPALTPAMPIK